MKSILLLNIVFILSSCSTFQSYHVSAIETKGHQSPLPAYSEVKIYLTNKPESYEELGIVQVVCEGKGQDLIDVVVEKAKEKGRALGGNCIILIGDHFVSEFKEGSSGTGTISSSPSTLSSYIKYIFIVARI